ncbi:MAG TPA: polysialyltransferase family glycosyltransferase [Pseudomonadales bacterium]
MNNPSPAHLFLVSTPLHLMVAIAIADTEQLANAHLLFIDQTSRDDNPYYQLMQHWPDSPFCSLSLFMRAPRGLRQKRHARRDTFAGLNKLLAQLQPAHIYCGNDRRIEFQYCMHVMKAAGRPATGYYMDEGAFTYVGRKASDSFSDRIVDNLGKKLAYGWWWKHPPTVGASAWVDYAYLSFPALAEPRLQQKPHRQLTLAYWQSPRLQAFCRQLLADLGMPARLAGFDVFFTLPHESVINAAGNYRAVLLAAIDERLAAGKRVGVKYHPRDSQADALAIGALPGVELLDRRLPFEALLPLFGPQAEIIGDFSTTLISTRLLRPDLAVTAIDHGQGGQSALYAGLYRQLGITVIH